MAVQGLAGEIERRRLSRFVGRQRERAAFASLLAECPARFRLLHIHGPGGVGKSALLHAFLRQAEEAGIRAGRVDGREVPADAQRFAAAVRAALGVQGDEPLERALGRTGERCLLAVDTCEALRPLEDWLREALLPQLPETALVILADREPLSLSWRLDAGWRDLLAIWQLQNFDERESRAYLDARAVPPQHVDHVLAFARGHPLALALAADAVLQSPDLPFAPERTPALVTALVRQMVERVPAAEQRDALEAAALVRCLDERLLAAMAATPDARGMFEWLAGLSVVQTTAHGLVLHETLQSALSAECRWRNPARQAAMVARARTYYAERLQRATGEEQRRLLADYLFLHRDNDAARPYLAAPWSRDTALATRPADPAQAAALVESIRRFEGADSATSAARWVADQPGSVLALVDGGGNMRGGAIVLAVDSLQRDEGDPCVQMVRAHVHHRIGGGRASLVRHWLATDTHQAVSPAQAALFVSFVQHYLATPDLRFSFIACADPDFWAPWMQGSGFRPLPACSFSSGARRYGVFARDWRPLPPLAWLQLIGTGERLTTLTTQGSMRSTAPGAPALAERDFAPAVRDALRHLREPDLLARNPLLHAPLVVQRVPATADESARVAALRAICHQAVDSLAASPRRTKLHRALSTTFLGATGTQEEAAEALELPFSTYRGHLKAGIDLVTETLWRLNGVAEATGDESDGLGNDSAPSRQ